MPTEPFRAPIRRRIAFVWRWRRVLGLRDALLILRNGVGGVYINRDGEGRYFFV